MLLDIEAVLQPQRPEVVLGQLAGQESTRLVAKLLDSFVDEAAVEGIVAVHGGGVLAPNGSPPGPQTEGSRCYALIASVHERRWQAASRPSLE